MMIHNPVYGTWGEATDLRHAADILDEVKETIINAYQLKTGRSRNYISRLMDEETYMSAKKALAEGFADSMLYRPTEQQTEDQAPAVAFGRLKIINTAAEASRNFMQEYTRRYNQAHPPDAGTRKIPVDTYDYLKSRNERRLRT
jgi:ATP-dependent Clp protease protease subunit